MARSGVAAPEVVTYYLSADRKIELRNAGPSTLEFFWKKLHESQLPIPSPNAGLIGAAAPAAAAVQRSLPAPK